jgi:hypothetical protein
MTFLITFLALTGLVCWIFILFVLIYIYLEK